jgi:hypothetical protein
MSDERSLLEIHQNDVERVLKPWREWLAIRYRGDPDMQPLLEMPDRFAEIMEIFQQSTDSFSIKQAMLSCDDAFRKAYATLAEGRGSSNPDVRTLEVSNALKAGIVLQRLLPKMQKGLDTDQQNMVKTWLNAPPTPASIAQLHAYADYAITHQVAGCLMDDHATAVKRVVAHAMAGRMDKLSDEWLSAVPELTALVSTDPLRALESGTRLNYLKSEVPTVVYYSFDDPNTTQTGANMDQDPVNMSPEHRALVRKQLSEVAAVCNVRFVEQTVFDSTHTPQWRFHAADILDPDVSAHAQYPRKGVQHLVFDPQKFKTLEQFKETILHEVEHALGAKHPFEIQENADIAIEYQRILPRPSDSREKTLMSYTKAKFPAETPVAYDMLWLQTWYGKNCEHNALNTHYQIHNNGLSTRVIWDADGRNWIDASRVAASTKREDGVTINLRDDLPVPLDFSGRPTTIKSGPGVVVERATGSPNSDFLISGKHQYVLEGGGGADTFVFGAGGKHYITDFTPSLTNTGQGDHLLLPSGMEWQTIIRPDGLLHLHGVSKATQSPLDIVIKPVGVTAQQALEAIRIDAEDKNVPYPREGSAVEKGLNAIADKLKAWAGKPIPIEEVAHLNAGDATNIRATPVARASNTTPAKH